MIEEVEEVEIETDKFFVLWPKDFALVFVKVRYQGRCTE